MEELRYDNAVRVGMCLRSCWLAEAGGLVSLLSALHKFLFLMGRSVECFRRANMKDFRHGRNTFIRGRDTAQLKGGLGVGIIV